MYIRQKGNQLAISKLSTMASARNNYKRLKVHHCDGAQTREPRKSPDTAETLAYKVPYNRVV